MRRPTRLKSAGGNKTIEGLLALGCERRVVLTGTPVQNDLQEFYALLSFATPGVLGPMGTFKRVYAGRGRMTVHPSTKLFACGEGHCSNLGQAAY